MTHYYRDNPSPAFTFDDCTLVPRYSEIESRSSCSLKSQLTRHFWVDIPFIAAPMKAVCGSDMAVALYQHGGAAGAIHRYMSIEKQVNHVRQVMKECLEAKPVVAAVGVTDDYQERAIELLKAGVEILILDVAHGHHIHVKRALEWLNGLSARKHFDVIAGNIATERAALDLEVWGADALRVGIGGGSVCETRIRAGVGIPQISCIENISKAVDIPVVCDGGIRTPGDAAKALAAGADTIMIGYMFAGTQESPGNLISTGKRKELYKEFYGSASMTQKRILGKETAYVEGTSTLVPFKGSVNGVIQELCDGVRSAMSYLGVSDVRQMNQVAEFVLVTQAGLTEAQPHGVI